MAEDNEVPSQSNSTDSTKAENKTPTENIPKSESVQNSNNTESDTNIKMMKDANNSTVAGSEGNAESENVQNLNNTQPDTNIKMVKEKDNSTVAGSERNADADNGTRTGRRLFEDKNSQGSHDEGSESKSNSNKDVPVATVENDKALEGDADSSFDLLRDNDELPDEYSYDYEDYVDESLWGDEEWTEQQHEKLEDYVNVDAHVLCTPVCS